MGLTIDEAIKKAREVAETNMYKAKTYDDDFLKRFHTNTEKCKQCAEEHEQLAEWLEKLKDYEQAEEDGLLHKAPIPNGTIIYLWAENDDDEMIIHSESYLYGVTEFLYGKFGEDFWDSEEQALAKMKGE